MRDLEPCRPNGKTPLPLSTRVRKLPHGAAPREIFAVNHTGFSSAIENKGDDEDLARITRRRRLVRRAEGRKMMQQLPGLFPRSAKFLF